jgi:hypothetical protein
MIFDATFNYLFLSVFYDPSYLIKYDNEKNLKLYFRIIRK